MPKFVILRGRATVCAMRTNDITYCDQVTDGDTKPAIDGMYQVCPICRMGAAAYGVDLPRAVGVEA
jgi:hypothetical protein